MEALFLLSISNFSFCKSQFNVLYHLLKSLESIAQFISFITIVITSKELIWILSRIFLAMMLFSTIDLMFETFITFELLQIHIEVLMLYKFI